ncbi:hypothetical protein GE09DRAFT_190822 [Coniochaeta sp. 2T2.1]|nr:hypothetical protein GE09DRAFT_190822 [Coniochaeta sp. 2T2.1]
MALVDYTSSSDSESSSPPVKKRKESPPPPSSDPVISKPSPSKPAKPTSSQLPRLRPSRPASPNRTPPPSSSTSQPSSSPSNRPQPPSQPPLSNLPPLPPSFHDLYAHTVRHSPVDIPSQHQNRRRTIPHVAGNWPSHVYIEWRPSSQQHLLLGSFLSALQTKLSSTLSSKLSSGHEKDVELHQFLSSDLGAPLPLHISLSRPFVLTTGEKDGFLEQIRGEIEGSKVGDRGRRGGFRLSCAGGVEWHRTGESGRSFLVLRVRSVTPNNNNRRGHQSANGAEDDDGGKPEAGQIGREDDEAEGEEGGGGERKTGRNPELTKLLERCNTTVASYGQPELYAARATDGGDAGRVGDAFHVSIA